MLREYSNDELEKFKSINEDDTCIYHFGTGRQIRNNWNLWDEMSRLHLFFKSIGIFHADDMSGIILLSLHRVLNKKPVNLKEQINFYKKYWEKYENEELV